jgi:hypothetical protein
MGGDFASFDSFFALSLWHGMDNKASANQTHRTLNIKVVVVTRFSVERKTALILIQKNADGVWPTGVTVLLDKASCLYSANHLVIDRGSRQNSGPQIRFTPDDVDVGHAWRGRERDGGLLFCLRSHGNSRAAGKQNPACYDEVMGFYGIFRCGGSYLLVNFRF